MWCPDVIRREGWEWVGRESESWLAMIPPPKGGRSPHRGVSTDWVERVGPGLRLLLYVIVSLYIILLIAGTYHPPSSFPPLLCSQNSIVEENRWPAQTGTFMFQPDLARKTSFCCVFSRIRRRKLATTTLQQQHQQQHFWGSSKSPISCTFSSELKKTLPVHSLTAV